MWGNILFSMNSTMPLFFVMLLARGIPTSASNDLLSKLKVLLADNSFMRTFYDTRLIDNTPF